jgi:rRNA pseudouridine-1189 N-methylase Emg1 (Nep1/Mra1 family)
MRCVYREESSKATDVRRLIVILEDAQLETGKVGAEHELLSSDKHATFLRKMGRDPADYRPDITHQCLLMLMDSPLNRAGMLRVFVHTARNVLIEISPQTRIPRTYDRFAGLMGMHAWFVLRHTAQFVHSTTSAQAVHPCR